MTDKINVLDLFCGLGGWSAAFEERGHNIVSVDILKKFNPTICADIMDLDADYFKDFKQFDVILASPPCNCFSIASVYRHWDKTTHQPKDDATIKSIVLVKHTLKLIGDLNPKFWYLENPRGMLRTVIGMPTRTIYMAHFGTPYLKPTDLWGNHAPMKWPEGMPINYEKASRGMHTGIQGIISKGAGCGKGGRDCRPTKISDVNWAKASLLNKKHKCGLMAAGIRSPELRALIPYKLSNAVCLACEGKI